MVYFYIWYDLGRITSPTSSINSEILYFSISGTTILLNSSLFLLVNLSYNFLEWSYIMESLSLATLNISKSTYLAFSRSLIFFSYSEIIILIASSSSWLYIFACILFSIFFALIPKRKVDKVWSKWVIVGLIHKIINVREFPPREDLSILVRDEFLYGTWLLINILFY